MSLRHEHERVRSEMERVHGADPLFRPRCSCGWNGEPVDASKVVIAYDAHVEQALAARPPVAERPDEDG